MVPAEPDLALEQLQVVQGVVIVSEADPSAGCLQHRAWKYTCTLWSRSKTMR
jgi:hypothetical protein